jgi:hypothetical protein
MRRPTGKISTSRCISRSVGLPLERCVLRWYRVHVSAGGAGVRTRLPPSRNRRGFHSRRRPRGTLGSRLAFRIRSRIQTTRGGFPCEPRSDPPISAPARCGLADGAGSGSLSGSGVPAILFRAAPSVWSRCLPRTTVFMTSKPYSASAPAVASHAQRRCLDRHAPAQSPFALPGWRQARPIAGPGPRFR